MYGIMETACAYGMRPDEFWEAEPYDTLIFIDNAAKQRQRDIYNQSYVTAQLFGVVLANSFRDKGKSPIPFPSFYEVFDIPDPSKTKENAFQRRIEQLRAHPLPKRK